jgi:ATP:ADP antiporter, AAA family
VHRVTTELVYLPVPAAARARAKPFIDGALGRITQAVAGGSFLVLGAGVSPKVMAAIASVLAVAWVAAAVTTRRPYLGLLRRAIDRGADPGADPLDLESASTLLQLLASEDPTVVLGAMSALARRGRQRLIPALILLHENGGVVVRALSLFSASTKEEWVPRARRLLRDPRSGVRKAAARALAHHGQLELGDLMQDATPWVRGYVALHARLAGQVASAGAVGLEELLTSDGPEREQTRLGVLSAIADVPRNRDFLPLLLTLAEQAPQTREWSEELSRAAVVHQATVLIPDLIERLALRDGREAVRDALAALGSQALATLWSVLQDTARARSLRVHLPNSIARFGTRQVADLLLECIETETDGLVRYKALRALQRLVVDKRFAMNRERIERLLHRNLEEHLRLTGLRAAFDASTLEAPTERLLVRLLDDKLSQAIERAFRLLQIAHPAEDMRSVRLALASKDRRARANAIELVDTLLRHRDQRVLSALFRLVTDDLPRGERAARAAQYVRVAKPKTIPEALALLSADPDATVAALAQLHAAALSGHARRVEITRRVGPGAVVELSTAAAAAPTTDG